MVSSTEEARVHIRELGTHLSVKLVEDSPSVLSLGRLCDELETSHSWQTGGNRTLSKGKHSVTCGTINFVLSVAVIQHSLFQVSGLHFQEEGEERTQPTFFF